MTKIKHLRKSQSLSAMELVDKAGLDLNQPLMSAVESGKVLPTRSDLWDICIALNCTPIELFDNVEDFDLMDIQRRLNRKVVDYKILATEFPTKFDKLPNANPKRTFRMSDEEWDYLKYKLECQGYHSLKQFLRINLLYDMADKKRA